MPSVPTETVTVANREDEGVNWRPPAGSWASSPGNRRSMLGNRGRNTKPELLVRRLLHGAGLRYRVDISPVPNLKRKADIVFSRLKIAVFIDGCFWHGCPDHYALPKTNTVYWTRKIGGNSRRDAETTTQLRSAGWTVLRFWSHQPAGSVAQEILTAVRFSYPQHAHRSSARTQK
jgi:DNA mismatch endonuclease (patch repair protein)